MVFFKVPSVSGLSSDSTCKVGLKDESAKEGLNQEAAEGCALPEQESETRLRKLGNPGKRIPITLVQGKGMLWVIRKRAPKRCARGPGSNIPGWAKETKVVGGTFLEKKKRGPFIHANAYAENTLATWCKEPTHWNRPWCWGRLKTKEKGAEKDELFRWHHWLNRYEFEQTLGDSGGRRSLACCSPWGQNELETT